MFRRQICDIEIKKIVTFHNTYSNKLTVSLITLCNSFSKIELCPDELIFTFLYAGSSTKNAKDQFVLCIQLSFVDLALHSTHQKNAKSRLKQLNIR